MYRRTTQKEGILMTQQLLLSRELKAPKVCAQKFECTRKAWLEKFLAIEYGEIPPQPSILSWGQKGKDEELFGGRAIVKHVDIMGEQRNITGRFQFPVDVVLPKIEGKIPFFVHIAFDRALDHKYLPLEDLVSRGFGLINVHYESVTSDDEDFLNGCAPVAGPRTRESAGKIAIWAWAAMRAMDFSQSLPQLDQSRAFVIGHSRLGKTALLAGAMDPRFACVIANDSGCGGAAVYRGKDGEGLFAITDRFPFWFKESFADYANKEAALPFDQHLLIAACYPRRVLVGSASEDAWADPVSEYLSCVLAGKVYEDLGEKGLVSPDRLPEVGDVFQDGKIGYHLRAGEHALTREDWAIYMDALEGK